jgi:hypothetical protein
MLISAGVEVSVESSFAPDPRKTVEELAGSSTSAVGLSA